MDGSVILGRKLRIGVKLGRNFFLGSNKEANFKVVSKKEFSLKTTLFLSLFTLYSRFSQSQTR
jgi:hypothetical protein